MENIREFKSLQECIKHYTNNHDSEKIEVNRVSGEWILEKKSISLMSNGIYICLGGGKIDISGRLQTSSSYIDLIEISNVDNLEGVIKEEIGKVKKDIEKLTTIEPVPKNYRYIADGWDHIAKKYKLLCRLQDMSWE